MKRREFLAVASAAITSLFFPAISVRGFQGRRPKVLYFTRCAGFEHSVVRPGEDGKSHSQKVIQGWADRYGVELVCTKDGRIFDDVDELQSFDVISFYTSGDLCSSESKQNTPPMSAVGKKRLLDTIGGGKGFVGFHAATDSFHTPGERNANQEKPDPYIEMIGGEFIKHGPQQIATIKVTSPTFAVTGGLGTSFELHEEWYTHKNFHPDLHVILVQETSGMEGACYQRPAYPSTWARKYGDGRVFYTSLGHREDVWTSALFEKIALAGFGWASGNRELDVTPNLSSTAPSAHQLSAEL
jgi:type 1 glutamine amidotransferase